MILSPSVAARRSNKLEAISVRLVPSHLEVREETFDRLFECHPMNCQFVRFEIVLEISRREPVPIDHTRDCTVRARAEQYSPPGGTNKGGFVHEGLPRPAHAPAPSRPRLAWLVRFIWFISLAGSFGFFHSSNQTN